MGCQSSVPVRAHPNGSNGHSPIPASSSANGATSTSGTISKLSASANGKSKNRLVDPGLFVAEPPMSSIQLKQLRREFWSNCEKGVHGGNSSSWEIIKKASQALLDGDIGQACHVIQSSNIKVVNESLGVCKDKGGEEYKVPEYCYKRPKLLVEDPAESPSTEGRDETEKLNESSNGACIEKDIQLRVRTSDGRHDLLLKMNRKVKVLHLKRRIQEELATKSSNSDNNMPPLDVPPFRQRFFFNGKEFGNDHSLLDLPEGTYAPASKKVRKNTLQAVQVFLLPRKQ